MSPTPLDQQSLQAREQEIIDATLAVLEEIDVSALTMDKVVERVSYSKGTVYSHFSGKEDLLSAIGNYALRSMLSLLQKAEQHPGCSRERYLGMKFAYLIWNLLNPTLARVALCSKSPSVQGKTSEERTEEHEQLEQKMMTIWHRQLDQGVLDGSLVLPAHMSKQQVGFVGWASGFGTINLLSGDLDACGGRHGLYLEREYLNNMNICMDGLGWKPLSSERDYRGVILKMLDQRFSAELEELRSRGRHLLL